LVERNIGLAGGARYRNDTEVVKLDSLVVSSSREMDGAAIAIKRTEAAKLVDDTAAAIVSNVEAGRLDEAERQLAEAEKDPALAGAAKVADARAALAKARGAIASRKPCRCCSPAGRSMASIRTAPRSIIGAASMPIGSRKSR
jgi:hypothetical protein